MFGTIIIGDKSEPSKCVYYQSVALLRIKKTHSICKTNTKGRKRQKAEEGACTYVWENFERKQHELAIQLIVDDENPSTCSIFCAILFWAIALRNFRSFVLPAFLRSSDDIERFIDDDSDIDNKLIGRGMSSYELRNRRLAICSECHRMARDQFQSGTNTLMAAKNKSRRETWNLL